MNDLLKKIEFLWGTPIFYRKERQGALQSFGTYPEEESPFMCDASLSERLIEIYDRQGLPVVYKDEFEVYFICVRGRDGYYLAGPCCTEEMDFAALHRFYKHYQVEGKEDKHPERTSLIRIMTFAAALSEMTGGCRADAEELLRVNGLAEESEREKEDVILELKRLDDEAYHHTYQEERHVLECVREGRKKEAVQRVKMLIETAGVLSGNRLNHYKYLAIVTVTVNTREAIAGGVSPAAAYRRSDVLINQIDQCNSKEGIIEYMQTTVGDFAEMVRKVKDSRKASGYTEQCKDYIYKNYHRKIYLEEIAEAIGISQGHLSRVFHEDTGMSVQDYILQFRVERAANLLRYSEASLMEISEYVCFNSQSHFGRIFKKYMKMTPKQYREKYKTKEFYSEKHV